ncbi:hypothetical protein [Glycomyces salinus]|uniref:hypothetical protein n=1 Tax=Glycomyces salinus TaxID=980294 RepID=UPI0018EC8C0D|nr:hypothetical protein [Glycomyces salinus]
MAGAEVFSMEPDKVYDAVEALFGVEVAIRSAGDELLGECESTAEALTSGHCAIGDALDSAANFWCGGQAARLATLVGNLGEYLATAAEQTVEIDEYTSDDFARYADHELFPGRAAEQGSARPDW